MLAIIREGLVTRQRNSKARRKVKMQRRTEIFHHDDVAASKTSEMAEKHHGQTTKALMELLCNGGEEETGAKVLKLVEDLSKCLDLLSKCLEARPTSLRTLSDCLRAVLRTFEHCQSSESTYGSFFASAASALAVLFKRAFALHKLASSLLDRLKPDVMTSEEDISAMKSIVDDIVCIGEVSSSFDAVCLQSCWKVVVRLLTKFEEVVDDIANCSYIASCLCLVIRDWLLKCWDSDPASSKSVRAVRFLCSQLLKLCYEFEESVVANVEGIFGIALSIQSAVPSMSEETTTLLPPVIEPLIGLLESNSEYAAFLSKKRLKISEQDGHAYLQLLLQLCRRFHVLSEGVQDTWMEKTSSAADSSASCLLLDAVFDAVESAYASLALPMRVDASFIKGKASESISFYEFVCIELSIFIARLPAKHFASLERLLLRHVLSARPQCAVLAIDLWCFVARWGNAQLCLSHVRLLTDLLTSPVAKSTHPGYGHACCLLRRIFPLLAEEHQAKFIETHSPASNPNNLVLWKDVGMPSNQRQSLVEACFDVITAPKKQCVHLLECAIQCLIGVVESGNFDTAFNYLPTILSSSRHSNLASIYLHFIGAAAPQLRTPFCSEILRVCTLANDELQTADFLVGMAAFLGALGKKRFHPQVLSLLSALYHKMFVCEDEIVQHHALIAFQAFAESTPHTEAIQLCMPEEMRPKFASFLEGNSATTNQSTISMEDLHRANQQLKTVRYWEVVEEEDPTWNDVNEPAKKRMKPNSPSAADEKDFQQAIDSIWDGIRKVESFLTFSLPPNWLKTELTTADEVLQKIIKEMN